MLQMSSAVPANVAQERADEVVLAGSAPSMSYAGDPIAHVHRGTSFIVLVDLAIVIFFTYTELVRFDLLDNAMLRSALLGASLFVGLTVYSGYRQRKSWAYWPAVGVLFLACTMFVLIGLGFLFVLLISSDITSLIFALLMGWAAFGSGRRALFHWHPAYRSGYHNTNPLTSFELQDGEMLAACPSCLAVLAIRPALLGRADRCPHCGNGLVSDALLQRHTDEEA
jgi:hypothetical protein